MASARDLAKRALITLIKFLAGVYSITVVAKRDSPDEEVRKAYRTLSRRVHPDKGGQKGEQEQLNAAYEKWCGTLKGTTPAGRPKKGEARTSAERPAQPEAMPALGDKRQAFRIKSSAVLLTYQGVADVAQWRRLVGHVRAQRAQPMCQKRPHKRTAVVPEDFSLGRPWAGTAP